MYESPRLIKHKEIKGSAFSCSALCSYSIHITPVPVHHQSPAAFVLTFEQHLLFKRAGQSEENLFKTWIILKQEELKQQLGILQSHERRRMVEICRTTFNLRKCLLTWTHCIFHNTNGIIRNILIHIAFFYAVEPSPSITSPQTFVYHKDTSQVKFLFDIQEFTTNKLLVHK